MTMFFIAYFLLINLLSLYLMYADKRKSVQKTWRIPESNLFFLCLMGGFAGIFLGMKYFHHKMNHWRFHVAVVASAFFWVLAVPFLAYFFMTQS